MKQTLQIPLNEIKNPICYPTSSDKLYVYFIEIDFWPLVPQKLSVESSINDDIQQKSMFTGPCIVYILDWIIGLLNNTKHNHILT